MKGTTIALDRISGQEAAALIVDGVLEDLLIAADAPPVGTIYRAIPRRMLKGQGGTFLDTPDGPAYLRQTKGVAPGKPILVQVTGYAEPGKAIPVTSRLVLKSRYAIATPGAAGINLSRQIRDEDIRNAILETVSDLETGDIGIILRSACADADPNAMLDDLQATLQTACAVVEDVEQTTEKLLDGDSPHQFAWREWTMLADVDTGSGAFQRHDVLERIDALLHPSEHLGNGASLWIEPTRALVAIDVNTGADTSLAAGLKANLATARALPRILRLRGLGGQVTLDLAPMPKKDRRGFETALKAAFRKDTIETILAGWTPLGHFELQRRRDRYPLTEVQL